jgi:hypothetical protein
LDTALGASQGEGDFAAIDGIAKRNTGTFLHLAPFFQCWTRHTWTKGL